MHHIKRLLSWSSTHHKNTISELELQKLLQISEYQFFYEEITALTNKGVLNPVKASGKNGRLPALHNKYRIIKPQLDYSRYKEQIIRLEPTLNISAYLQKPETYLKHQEVLEGLSSYLWEKKALLQHPMSRKERSFSIWGKEKYLDQHFSLWREVQRFNNLPEKVLNYYDTPEPFFEYVDRPSEQLASMTILILENKDTWFTLRKLLQETGCNRLGPAALDVLLYGEGNKITKAGALEGFIHEMYGKATLDTKNSFDNTKINKNPTDTINIKVLYCGDFDREGIRLFFRTQKANPGLQIEPFAWLYHRMLELAENVDLPYSQDNRQVEVPLAKFLTLLDLALPSTTASSPEILKFWQEGKYIPQEILNYQVLADLLRKEDQHA